MTALTSYKINLGPGKETRKAQLEVEIRSTDKGPELSVCGVIWDKRSRGHEGDSYGQNVNEIRDNYPDDPIVGFFHAICKRWHLNGFRAGCEHQRVSPLFKPQDITLPRAEVSWDHKRQLERDYEADVLRNWGTAQKAELKDPPALHLKVSPAAQILHTLNLLGMKPFSKVAYNVEDFERYQRIVSQFKEFVEAGGVKLTAEHANTVWLRPDEHPLGFLTKPCDVCGYKYGTEWKYEQLPQPVIDAVNAFASVAEREKYAAQSAQLREDFLRVYGPRQ